MERAAELTPHTSVMIYNSTYEGAEPIAELMNDDSVDEARRCLGREQTGEETPLRSTSGYLRPTNPRPKTEAARRMHCLHQEEGVSIGIDQSKVTAGISMETLRQQLLLQRVLKTVEEGCTARVREIWIGAQWPPNSVSSKQAQPTRQHDVQPANRGSNPWTDWAREVRNSQPPIYPKTR